jgi:hypothetical protein
VLDSQAAAFRKIANHEAQKDWRILTFIPRRYEPPVVLRGVGAAPGIAGRNLLHVLDLIEDGVDAPEASARKDRGLAVCGRSLGLRLQRNARDFACIRPNRCRMPEPEMERAHSLTERTGKTTADSTF